MSEKTEFDSAYRADYEYLFFCDPFTRTTQSPLGQSFTQKRVIFYGNFYAKSCMATVVSCDSQEPVTLIGLYEAPRSTALN